MKIKNIGTHAYHCCAIHGCKYGDKECPVTTKKVEQEYTCQWCDESGFHTIDDVKQYVHYEKELQSAIEQGHKTIEVDVNFLTKMMKNENM